MPARRGRAIGFRRLRRHPGLAVAERTDGEVLQHRRWRCGRPSLGQGRCEALTAQAKFGQVDAALEELTGKYSVLFAVPESLLSNGQSRLVVVHFVDGGAGIVFGARRERIAVGVVRRLQYAQIRGTTLVCRPGDYSEWVVIKVRHRVAGLPARRGPLVHGDGRDVAAVAEVADDQDVTFLVLAAGEGAVGWP